MEIDLPYRVKMSVNSMYRVTRQGKFLKREALTLRARIIDDVKDLKENVEDLDGRRLIVGIVFSDNWYCLNGEVKVEDLDNRLKFIIDSVFRGLGLNDKMIFELYARKNQTDEPPYTTIIIDEAKGEVWERPFY